MIYSDGEYCFTSAVCGNLKRNVSRSEQQSPQIRSEPAMRVHYSLLMESACLEIMADDSL